MGSPVIDGRRWIAERLRFLREQLSRAELTEEERRRIEAEIDTLSREGGIMSGGRRQSRLWRWLRRSPDS